MNIDYAIIDTIIISWCITRFFLIDENISFSSRTLFHDDIDVVDWHLRWCRWADFLHYFVDIDAHYYHTTADYFCVKDADDTPFAVKIRFR